MARLRILRPPKRPGPANAGALMVESY